MTSPQALFIPSHSSIETQQALRGRRVLREGGGFAVILDNGIPVSSAFPSRVMKKNAGSIVESDFTGIFIHDFIITFLK